MPINSKIVRRIGDLARIDLSITDVDIFSEQLGEIVDLMNQLDGVDTSRVEEMDSEIGNGHENRPKDIVSDGNCIESILKNAPETKEGFFTVKKVIE